MRRWSRVVAAMGARNPAGRSLPLGVTGNTPDSGSGESWFEPRRGNGRCKCTGRFLWGSAWRLQTLPLNADGPLETPISCPKFARRDYLESHVHVRADQRAFRDDTIEHGRPCGVVLRALDDRLKRAVPAWVCDLVTSLQLNDDAVVERV